MNDEYLTRCVVDVFRMAVYIYSDQGTHKEVVCDTSDEFVNILQLVRSTVDERIVSYSSAPL